MIFLKDALITAIALCKRGKNQMRTLYKSADSTLELQTLTKANAEVGELLNVVYAPNRPDDDGEGMSAIEIRKAAHLAMQGGLDLDIEHDGKLLPREEAWVAETFIVSKGDERFQNWRDYQNNLVGDLTGAWASIIRLESEELRKACRDGDFDGVSMFGTAAVEQKKSSAATNVVRRLEDATKEIDMDKEEFKALLKASSDALLAKVDEKIAAIAKSVTEAKDNDNDADNGDETNGSADRPVFKGNVTNSEELAAYQAELGAFELNQKIAKGQITAEQLSAIVKAAAEGEPSDDEAGIEKADNAEVKQLKRDLFKAKNVSNVSKAGKDTEEGAPKEFDAKAAYDLGKEICKSMRGSGAPTPAFNVVKKTD